MYTLEIISFGKIQRDHWLDYGIVAKNRPTLDRVMCWTVSGQVYRVLLPANESEKPRVSSVPLLLHNEQIECNKIIRQGRRLVTHSNRRTSRTRKLKWLQANTL